MHGKSYICQRHCAFLPQIIVLHYVTSTAEDLLDKITFLYMGLSCKELETQAKIERMTDILLMQVQPDNYYSTTNNIVN